LLSFSTRWLSTNFGCFVILLPPTVQCICWPGSLLAQMGLLGLAFEQQVKEVYLGKQSFSKETGLDFSTVHCWVL